MNKQKTKVTVGIPAYNNEKFIRKAIDSVLSQTFSDFELIISDDASTDSTPTICDEYKHKDDRIHFIRQEENKGAQWNFSFLVDQAKSEYFVWLAADDFWSPYFLEKSVNILESDKNVAFSIGKVEPFGPNYNHFKTNPSDSFIKKNYKKIRRHYRPHHYHSAVGSYEKRIGSCLRHSIYLLFFYALFRTEILQEIISKRLYEVTAFDKSIPLIALRYGNAHVIDEVLTNRYTAGMGSGQNPNIIEEYHQGRIKFSDMFFYRTPFIKWCWKNLGKKVFLKNLDCFIRLGFHYTEFFFISLIRYVGKLLMRLLNKN